MADPLTDFIIKPSAPFAAGVILFTVVWGFFKGVESVLTDDTKLEIAVWLVGVKPIGPKMEPWPDTFAKIFDGIFGKSHLSLRCFLRSAMLSVLLYGFADLIIFLHSPEIVATVLQTSVRDGRPFGYDNFRSIGINPLRALPTFFCVAIIGDYIALLETRFILGLLIRYRRTIVLCAGLLLDAVITILTARAIFSLNTHFVKVMEDPSVSAEAMRLVHRLPPGSTVRVVQSVSQPTAMGLWFYPALFTSIWLWLYAGSGFFLKAARRFDLGFDWFNRHFDIEHKPLSAIGLVAGSLVAVLRWTVMIVKWIV
jgi:hypothetical protein